LVKNLLWLAAVVLATVALVRQPRTDRAGG
jgi:hypothetical protein